MMYIHALGCIFFFQIRHAIRIELNISTPIQHITIRQTKQKSKYNPLMQIFFMTFNITSIKLPVKLFSRMKILMKSFFLKTQY